MGWGGEFLGEVKERGRDIVSFSLGYLSKSRRTIKPHPSLDTPARPADLQTKIRVTSQPEEELAPKVLQRMGSDVLPLNYSSMAIHFVDLEESGASR